MIAARELQLLPQVPSNLITTTQTSALNRFFCFVILTNFFLDIPEVFMNGTAEEFLAIDKRLGLTLEFSNHVPKFL